MQYAMQDRNKNCKQNPCHYVSHLVIDLGNLLNSVKSYSVKQYFSYFMAVSIIGGGNRSTQRNPLY